MNTKNTEAQREGVEPSSFRPAISPFELLSIAMKLNPGDPSMAFAEATSMLEEAARFITDPDYFLPLGDRIESHLAATRVHVVHFPKEGEPNQDMFRDFAKSFGIALPSRSETLLQWCREWLALEEEAINSDMMRLGREPVQLERWFAIPHEPSRLPITCFQRLALYCRCRKGRAKAEANASYFAKWTNAEAALKQKGAKKQLRNQKGA